MKETLTRDLHKATITVGNATVMFEGPRDFVEQQVARYLAFTSKSQVMLGSMSDVASQAEVTASDLVQAKAPRGHAETVAVLAFWLTQVGLPEFTEDDMHRAYIQAGVRPPKVVGQALRDARSKFDYIGAGKKRGTYTLTSHGDRTVRFDLPRS